MNPVPQRITDFGEFVKLIPNAVKCFSDSYTRWSRDLSDQELITELVAGFKPENEFYIETRNGEILYFFVIMKIGEHKAHFWVIYVNPKVRKYTKPLIDWVLRRYKENGYETIEFTTTRLTRSYKRWTEKFKARPYAMVYKANLTENNY